jgi:thioredoxin-related protein
VGYLDRTISRTKPSNEIETKKNRFNNQDQVNAYDELRNNIQSQWSFFEEIKSKYKPQILMLPSYLIADNFVKLQQFVQENKHLNNLKMMSLNANFNEVLENRQYWADPGHLNRQGGIRFSNELKKVISIEN